MNNNLTNLNDCLDILENVYNRFQRSYIVFKELEKKDSKILEYNENLFLCFEDYMFFKKNFVLIMGFEKFISFEDEFFNKVISELRLIFFNSDLSYTITEDEFGCSVIKVSSVTNTFDYPILTINPYFKMINVLKDETILTKKQEIRRYNEIIFKLEEEEKRLELAIKNPIFNSENPLDMIVTTFRKNKKSDEIKIKLNEITQEIIKYNLIVKENETLLNDMNLYLLDADEDRNFICKKLSSFNYQIIDNEIIEDKIEDNVEEVKAKGLREINKKTLQ